MQESRCLRTKVHLAEQAQKEAQHVENNYEEVVRFLEAELADTHNNHTRHVVCKNLLNLSHSVRSPNTNFGPSINFHLLQTF